MKQLRASLILILCCLPLGLLVTIPAFIWLCLFGWGHSSGSPIATAVASVALYPAFLIPDRIREGWNMFLFNTFSWTVISAALLRISQALFKKKPNETT